MAPTPKRRKHAREEALKASLHSGRYPTFQGVEGPTNDLDPTTSSAFEYLELVWPNSLCDLMALETNKYAVQKGVSNWENTTIAEMWTLHRYMSSTRFWALWSNLHLVDNQTIANTEGISRKIQPLLDVLSKTFLEAYNPSQELAVDESMVKYKGRVTGKVHMPKKPIKWGFKLWCCSYSCCGYLCNFQLYEGQKMDLVTGKKVSEKGLVKRAVKDLVEPFDESNHVLYCDNYYSSGPLVEQLTRKKIYLAETIRKNAKGFPKSLKSVKLPKGKSR